MIKQIKNAIPAIKIALNVLEKAVLSALNVPQVTYYTKILLPAIILVWTDTIKVI